VPTGAWPKIFLIVSEIDRFAVAGSERTLT
jgi:hypothetical protein